MDVGVRPDPARGTPAAHGPHAENRPPPSDPPPAAPDEPTAEPDTGPEARSKGTPAAGPEPDRPPPDRPPPRGPAAAGGRARSRGTALLTVSLCLAALGGTGWVLSVGLGAAPEVTPAEGLFAVRSFAVNRFGFSAAHLPWYDGGLAALQVAAYETVSGALGRTATVVVAARETMVAAAVLTGASIALAARRLRLSVPATLAALLLAGLPPLAVLLHRTAEPANLAVLWACAAFALASAGPRRPGAAVGSACYLVLAVLTAPVVLVPLVPLYAYLLWNGDVGRLPTAARWAAAVGGLAGWAGLVVLTRRGALPGVTGGQAFPPLTGPDVGLLVVVAAGMLAALAVRWLRALAAGLLGAAVAAALAADARVPLVLVAIPLAALLLAAVGDAAAGRWTAWWTGPSRQAGLPPGRTRWVMLATAAAALAIAVVAAWVPTGTAVRGPGTDVSAARARDWVLASLPSRPRLAVDEAVWAELVQAGYPPDRLAAVGGLGAGGRASTHGWADATFVVGRDRALFAAAPGDPARQAREHSAAVAGFGDGVERVQIRRVLTDREAVARLAAADLRSRAEAGAALARNPRLRLRPDAAALLRRGDVDARVEVVLAGIAAAHRLDIATFPAVDGEDDRLPRRLVAVTSIDGRPVAAGGTVVTLLQQWLQAQQVPYRPAASTVAQLSGQTALLVSYDALRQTGLLPQ